MTLKELKEKNEKIRKEREAQKVKEPIVEQKLQTPKRSRGKKPANRQYMVVDQEPIEQYEESENKVEVSDNLEFEIEE